MFQKVRCAYVMLMMAVFWITEALPIAVTAFIPVLLFPLLELVDAKTVSSQYINVSQVRQTIDQEMPSKVQIISTSKT